MKLIPKSALVAEFNRLIAELVEKGEDTMFEQGRISAFEDAKLFLDTLEVREVDLDKEYEEFVVDDPIFGHFITNDTLGIELAKHFFELGMAVSNPLTVKDIKKIYHLVNEVSDDLGVRAMYVNIYQEALKRFKAQKGE